MSNHSWQAARNLQYSKHQSIRPWSVVVKYARLAVRLRKMASRIAGSAATYFSYKQKPSIPTAPMMSGRSVRHDDQSYMMPPQVRGMRKDVMLATKMKDPTQSTRRSFAAMLSGIMLSRRKSGTATYEMPMKGRLIQNIHLHCTMAKAPPYHGKSTNGSGVSVSTLEERLTYYWPCDGS